MALSTTVSKVTSPGDGVSTVFLSPELVHAAWDAIEGKTEVANG